ncbi:MAG TPA: dUTP diphosphatase [Devosiaceae bacterium]|nr:dUTP diphosphatase [Devosiaceae bacterium]
MTLPLSIAFRRLPHGADLPLPARQSAHAAGADLLAAIADGEEVEIAPGDRALVACGFCMAVPVGYEGQVRPRSGLAAKHGVTVLNAPGTIDADYRGEVKVILINHGDEPFIIRRGDRIAQLVVAPVTAFAFDEAEDLDKTARGENGFGSTGLRG